MKIWMIPHCSIYHLLRALALKLSKIIIMNGKEVKHCSLCFHNGEPEDYYSSHNLKTRDGKVVTCPVLRKFVCNICGATGDVAHTLRYCPFNKDGAFSRGASLPLLKTKKNAAGNFSNRRMICHPLPSSFQDVSGLESTSREVEAAHMQRVYSTRQPLAMRTFSSQSSYSATSKHSTSGHVLPASGCNPCAASSSCAFPLSRRGRIVPNIGSRKKVVPGSEQYFYPNNSSIGFAGTLARKMQADWGFSVLESKVEDVGKLLEELRMGTTAVEGW